MELLINFLIGTVLVPAFNWFKQKVGVTDYRAVLVLLPFLLLLAVPVALLSGTLSGLPFDFTEPFSFLESCGKAFLVLLGTSQGWYMLFFKNGKKK